MKKIFVGNLDFGATEEAIRIAFEAYGAVERVSLMTDRDTGRSRGFAFVEMTDSHEADQAIAGRKQFSISSPCDPLRSEPRLLIRSLDETDLCQRSDPLGKI